MEERAAGGSGRDEHTHTKLKAALRTGYSITQGVYLMILVHVTVIKLLVQELCIALAIFWPKRGHQQVNTQSTVTRKVVGEASSKLTSNYCTVLARARPHANVYCLLHVLANKELCVSCLECFSHIKTPPLRTFSGLDGSARAPLTLQAGWPPRSSGLSSPHCSSNKNTSNTVHHSSELPCLADQLTGAAK